MAHITENEVEKLKTKISLLRLIEKGLPIGSGEIESAHRYLVEQRLKRSGAWRCENNAESMLALRLSNRRI